MLVDILGKSIGAMMRHLPRLIDLSVCSQASPLNMSFS